MIRPTLTLLTALPGIVIPATAQQTSQEISASEFVESQMAIIKGMTALLSVKGIESNPQAVAGGIDKLSEMVWKLSTIKPAHDPRQAALVETELADQARAAAQGLQYALERTVEKNFYNSQELATAIQGFVAAFQSLK